MTPANTRYSVRVLELFRALPGAGALPSAAGRIATGEAMALDRGAWVRFEARVECRSNRGVSLPGLGMPAHACGRGACRRRARGSRGRWSGSLRVAAPCTRARRAGRENRPLAGRGGRRAGAAGRGRSGTIAASMAISLTPAAADRVRHFLSERGHGVGLRLGIRKTGCSGYAYVVNYADAVEPGDRVFDSHGRPGAGRSRQPQADRRYRGRLRAPGAQRSLPFQEPQRERRVRLRRELQRLIFPFGTGTSAHAAIAALRPRG